MENKELILFDLDGVLIDSRANMEKTWATVRRVYNTSVPFEEYFRYIGQPFIDIMNELGLSKNAHKIEVTFNHQSTLNMDMIEFYPNVENTLAALSKMYKLGVVTSKDTERTALILDKLETKFDIVATPNGILRGKPAPDHLLFSIAMMNVDPSKTIYVGDMVVDLMAAERSGIDYVHAEWGYGSTPSFVKSISSFEQLIPLLLG